MTDPAQPKPTIGPKQRSHFNNWISAIGAVVAAGGLFSFAFLVWMDFSAYNLSEKELMKRLIDGGVALNHGSKFGTGGDGYFRLNFGCPRATLEEGLLKMAEIF